MPLSCGDLHRRVALRAEDHAIRRQEQQRAGGRRAAQFCERHTVGGELLEQREAFAALLALEAVEQALRDEVDVLCGHRA